MNVDRTFEALLEEAAKGLLFFSAMTPEQYEKWAKKNPFVTSDLSLGNGQYVRITPEGYKAIEDFGLKWWESDAQARSVVSAAEVKKIALSIFGEFVNGNHQARLAADPKEKRVLQALLRERAMDLKHTLSHYFPCHIFEHNDVAQFAVGPVRFLPRIDWLNHVERLAGTQLSWVGLVRSRWLGEVGDGDIDVPPFKMDASPKESEDLHTRFRAKGTLEEVGRCQWIAIAEVPERYMSLSRSCAEVSVRVAIDTLGLHMFNRAALDLRGPGDNLSSTISRPMYQAPGRDIYESWKLDHPALKIDGKSAELFLTGSAKLREDAGAAITAFVQWNGRHSLPGLKKRWVEAMYWFGEARREGAEFIALVKCGIALDVLTQGKKAAGIENLCKGLFQCALTDPITTDGNTTLSELVREIYDEGRSQLGHGGRPGLLTELPVSLSVALEFTQTAMRHYLTALCKYIGTDDVDGFMAALPIT
jgi:hypothetical protein